MSVAVQKPVSSKRIEFAVKLGYQIAARSGDPEALEKAGRVESYMKTLDAEKASAYIDHLLSVVESLPRPVPELGYYLFEDSTVAVQESKSTGNRYAKRLVFVGGVKLQPKWVYEKGLIFKLEGLSPVTLEEAAARGHLTGRCFVCGRSLEKAASVQAGIGPVCAKKFQ